MMGNFLRPPMIQPFECRNVRIEGFQTFSPHDDGTVVDLKNVSNAFIHACPAIPGTQTFVQIRGEKSQDILFRGTICARPRRLPKWKTRFLLPPSCGSKRIVAGSVLGPGYYFTGGFCTGGVCTRVV